MNTRIWRFIRAVAALSALLFLLCMPQGAMGGAEETASVPRDVFLGDYCIHRGSQAMENGQYDQALTWFEMARDRFDGPAQEETAATAFAWLHIAWAHEGAEEYDEALEAYRRAAEIYEVIGEPDGYAYMAIAWLLEGEGSPEGDAEALKYYGMAAEAYELYDMPSGDAHFYAGLLLAQAGRNGEALDRFHRAEADNRKFSFSNAEVWLNIAWVLEADGDTGEAADYFLRAASTNSATDEVRSNAYYGLGILQGKMGRANEAVDNLKSAAAAGSAAGYATDWEDYSIAWILQEAGRDEEALAYFQKAAQGFEDAVEMRGDAYFSIGLLQQEAGRDDEALAAYNKAAVAYEAAGAPRGDLSLQYGLLLQGMDSMEDARACYERAIEEYIAMGYSQGDALYMRAQFFDHFGQLEASEADYQRAGQAYAADRKGLLDGVSDFFAGLLGAGGVTSERAVEPALPIKGTLWEDLYQRALELEEAGQAEAAMTVYGQAVTALRHSPRPGEVSALHENYEGMHDPGDFCAWTAALFPENVEENGDTLLHIAWMHEGHDQPEWARKYYALALAAYESAGLYTGDGYYAMATILRRLGRDDEALEMYGYAENAYDMANYENAATYKYMGELLRDFGREEEAERCFKLEAEARQ